MFMHDPSFADKFFICVAAKRHGPLLVFYLIFSFYTGSHTNYFAPRSRFEEIILLLLISEIIASQMVRVSRGENLKQDGTEAISEKHNDRTISFNNLKMVHNLLVLV